MADSETDGKIWVIRYRRYGDPDVCGLEYEDPPEPGRGQVRVATRVVSVNPVDWKLARGDFRIATGLRPNRIPGSDFAGDVISCGPGVTRVKAGDRVFGMVSTLGRGTYAEQIVVQESQAVPIPQEVGYIDAAALPLTSLTAFQSLFVHGRIPPGAHVLINGASGGVGVAALQLARIGGARVTAVASGPQERLCERLGASSFVDYRERDPLLARHDDYHMILDAVDTLDYGAAMDALHPGGTLVTLNPSLRAFFSSIRSLRHPRRHKVEMVRADGRQLGRIAEHVAGGRMVPIIQEVLPISEVSQAWRLSMQGHVVGKIVLDTRTGF
ncbi:MAG: NAD(P)-dependent alcohol dehydrogenase [bacterium]